MIRFNCPHCGKGIKVADTAAGKRGKCNGCGKVIDVPASPIVETAEQLPSVMSPQDVAPLQQPRFAGSPTPTTAIQVNVSDSRAAHSLGIASLVLGVLSFFVCWLPFIGLFFGGLGSVLGVIGLLLALNRQGSGIGYSIAGTAVSSVALVTGLIFMFAIARAATSVDEALSQSSNPQQAKPATGGPDNSDKPTSNEPVWTPSSTPLRLEDVEIRITDVVVGNIPLRQDATKLEAPSTKEWIAIWLQISNVSEKKKLDYQGWMSKFATLQDIDTSLTDESENKYRLLTLPPTLNVKDAETVASLYPGKSVKDAVLFEPPVDGVERLRLTLSAKAFRSDGEFRFEISPDMIRRE